MSVMLREVHAEKLKNAYVDFVDKLNTGDYENLDFNINMPNPVRAYLLQDGDIFTINDTIIEHGLKDKVSVFYELKEVTFFCSTTKMYFTYRYRTGKEFTQEELESLAHEKICNNLRDAIDKNSNSES